MVTASTSEQLETLGRGTEISLAGLALTGVYSNADLEANRKGLQFYRDFEANTGLSFSIKNYIGPLWNEQVNPSFYASNIGEVVWRNLLTGSWLGTMVHPGTPTPIAIKFDLTATGSSVNGPYEWPAGDAKANKGKISGTVTQLKTTVTGEIPSDFTGGAPAPATETPVMGVQIQFDWERGTDKGKGVLSSVGEQTLLGTWGFGTSRTNGGALHIVKA